MPLCQPTKGTTPVCLLIKIKSFIHWWVHAHPHSSPRALVTMIANKDPFVILKSLGQLRLPSLLSTVQTVQKRDKSPKHPCDESPETWIAHICDTVQSCNNCNSYLPVINAASSLTSSFWWKHFSIDFVGDDTKDHLVNPSRCTLVKRFQLLLPHVVSSTAQCCLQPDLLRLRPSRPSGLPQCLLHKLASMLLFKMSSHIKAPT